VQDLGTALLGVFLILTIKHFVCDYPLQTQWQLANKGTYGHPGGIVHSGIHVIGTALSFLIITPTLLIGIGIMVGEFLIHYHVDWAKDNLIRKQGWTSNGGPFWLALGTDQLAHHLTYVAIAAVLFFTAARTVIS
jgi:hypothetical protein